jgi:hypothetical protein
MSVNKEGERGEEAKLKAKLALGQERGKTMNAVDKRLERNIEVRDKRERG